MKLKFTKSVNSLSTVTKCNHNCNHIKRPIIKGLEVIGYNG